ncbi:Apolipoprotein N-acyltransferase GT2 [Halomonadaceae bacterium LMG 33818]|uniref:apolipoprotein N-acyltransferase n=1 Tax=Cernens ardua TaxID=3402176 RepID=UPI003EDBFFA7
MRPLFHKPCFAVLVALLLGALTTLTFAPFNFWWLGPMICAPLYALLRGTRVRKGMLIGFFYGVGLFGSGASWVYVSINVFGNANAIEATLLTLVFVLGLSLFYLIAAAFYRVLAPKVSCIEPLTFAAAWTLAEVFRGWFLTGFPWLFLGSAHLTSPLASYAPIGGVYLISFFVALSGALLWHLVIGRRLCAILPLALIWIVGALLPTQWLTPDAKSISVSLIQGNLPESEKWSFQGEEDAVNTYLDLTRQHGSQSDLVIWPEAALPMTLQDAMPVFASAQSSMKVGSSLISGIITTQGKNFFNSAVAFDQHPQGGMTTTLYRKYRLVPFGEYVPLEGLLRPMLGFFNLPTSHMSQGAANQPPLTANGLKVGMSICYEVVYPDLVREQAKHANMLVTISNDSWFGHSIGPVQQMQMAQMRALENNRYLMQDTSDGVTAVAAPDGRIIASMPRFVSGALNTVVHPVYGETLFTRTGSWPIILVSVVLVAAGAVKSRRQQQ